MLPSIPAWHTMAGHRALIVRIWTADGVDGNGDCRLSLVDLTPDYGTDHDLKVAIIITHVYNDFTMISTSLFVVPNQLENPLPSLRVPNLQTLRSTWNLHRSHWIHWSHREMPSAAFPLFCSFAVAFHRDVVCSCPGLLVSLHPHCCPICNMSCSLIPLWAVLWLCWWFRSLRTFHWPVAVAELGSIWVGGATL